MGNEMEVIKQKMGNEMETIKQKVSLLKPNHLLGNQLDHASIIFISICYTILKHSEAPSKDHAITQALCSSKLIHKISKKDILALQSKSKLNVESILQQEQTISSVDNFTIKFTEYAPKIFQYLRKKDNISPETMIKSFLPDANKAPLAKNEGGRGGATFLKTYDHKYLLKSLTANELNFLLNVFLLKYTNYITDNPNSIISRIYGVFSFSTFQGEEIFMILQDVFGVFSKDNVLSKFDLKGSKKSRTVKTDEIDKAVLKDNNFSTIEGGFYLNLETSQKLKEIIYKDGMFFKEIGVMDYSLLVVKLTLNINESSILFGSDHKEKCEKEFIKMNNMSKSDNDNDNDSNSDSDDDGKNKDKNDKNDNNDNNDNKEIDGKFINEIRFNSSSVNDVKKYLFPSLSYDKGYIFSIIDFFQRYDISKFIETKSKSITAKEEEISSMEPNKYFQRFFNKMCGYSIYGIRTYIGDEGNEKKENVDDDEDDF